ncbi:SGNH/GDSL hydrolase family protein, partial [Klebsiella pneumoniae]
MAADELNPPLGTTTPEIFLDNVKRADRLVNGPEETVDDRGGKPLDTWRQMMAKNDEIRQNIIPLSKQYMTLAAAQADIANIPVGSTTYYRSPDDSVLAVEVMNVVGALAATGRKMPAYSSLRRANILFDAFNEYSAIDSKFGAWDWYRGAALTFSTSDANIPLSTPVAQYSGIWSADKYYDLTRLPVRVGDQLTFSVLAWFQDAGAKFHIFWMSSSGAVISTKSQLALVTGINIPVITDVIPSGASYVRIRVENTTAGIFKVGAYAAALGAIQPDFVRATPDKTYLSAVISSGISGLTSRVDALQGAISVGYTYAATWQTGKFINPNTGVVTDNTALNCTLIPHSDGDGWLVTALVTGSATALAVYMNAAGTVLGVEGRGTTTPQQYTNYRLNVPAGTIQIGITGRNSAEMSVKKLAVVETATVLANIDSLDVRVQKIEDSLVYDFVKQDVTITSGAYINRANGAVVANSAFDCSVFSYTTGDRWKVTARVNGSGVSLAVYMNSAGTVIGTEGNGTTESVDYTDYELTPPSGTASIGITTRIAVPIIAKKYVVVPGGSTVSPWSGKVIDVMGDSNVA